MVSLQKVCTPAPALLGQVILDAMFSPAAKGGDRESKTYFPNPETYMAKQQTHAGRLLDLLRRLSCFGLALMKMDLRQESSRHTDALSAVTKCALFRIAFFRSC